MYDKRYKTIDIQIVQLLQYVFRILRAFHTIQRVEILD